MHSSRIRTARSSSHHGSGGWTWTRFPSTSLLGVGLDQIPPTSPLSVGLDQIPLNFPLGCGPGDHRDQAPPKDQTPPLWTVLQTPVKTLPCPKFRLRDRTCLNSIKCMHGNNICLSFPDFSSILCDFLWLENAFPLFQVFQPEWEPC